MLYHIILRSIQHHTRRWNALNILLLYTHTYIIEHSVSKYTRAKSIDWNVCSCRQSLNGVHYWRTDRPYWHTRHNAKMPLGNSVIWFYECACSNRMYCARKWFLQSPKNVFYNIGTTKYIYTHVTYIRIDWSIGHETCLKNVSEEEVLYILIS